MKPIAVLVLVLVAIGALIFGLVTLGGGKGGKSTNPVGPDPTQPAAKSPVKGQEIEKSPDATGRKADPATPAEDRTPASDFVYANELRALVVDAQHKPIPDVEVTLTTLSSNALFFVDSAIPAYQVGPLRTGADGRVSFLGVQPNHTSYTLVCVHPDYARQERSTVPIGQDGVFEEPPIVLTGGATLQGTVKDEAGSPIGGAKMVLEGLLAQQMQQSRAPDRQEATTDANGVYMIKNIPRGAQRSLKISATGFGRLIQTPLNFPETRPKSLDIVLKVAEMINGRVVGTGNQPLADVSMMALGVSGTQQTARDDQKSNERGEFQFENLVPGEYNIIARLKGWRFQPQNRVRTNTANLVFEGTRMPNVCGQVVDAATGAPVAQFSAQLRGFTDVQTPTAPLPETEAAFSDGGGNFCLEGVEQGRYVVEAWAPGYAPSRSENFVVSSDHNAEHVAVKLTRGGMISGRIVDSANRPVAKALLRTRPVDWGEDEFTSSIDDIFPSHATRVETRTDANGSFTLKGLSPDDYQVLIDASGFARSSKNNLTVTEGATTPMGDVRLERGGTLVGTVYDGTGKGVAGAGITLDSADSATPREYRTKSGIDGKFTLRNIAQGRYRARPSAPAGPEPNPLEDLRIGADAERQITIADEQESKIELILPASAPPPDVQPMPEEAPVKPSPENRPPVKRP